ncbi:MAG TPA: type IV secretory system conjugative DNA transfer family protein [Puia sp.]|nr:type IV secretory system conjugative DNA transfer family protein [Puia sp.]
MQKQSPSSHYEDWLLHVLFLLCFLITLGIGACFNPEFLLTVRDHHPGAFWVIVRLWRMVMPLYRQWYIVPVLYIFCSFIMGWISQGKKIHFRRFRSWLLPAVGVSIGLLLGSFFCLRSVPAISFGVCFSLYLTALLLCPATILLYKRSHDTPALSAVGPMSNRIRQNKSLHMNDASIHWKTTAGRVNLLNPFRGIMIVGGPGAGKSYTLIEPIIDQAIHKGFSALIYDFKFPTLSQYAYNAWRHAQEQGGTACDFYSIYFKDVRYSHRCNPLHPKILPEYAFANEASKTILYNINLNWAQKSGEFFSDSAVTILTGIIWYLRCKAVETGRNICSLPHVIEFCSYDDFDRTIEVMLDDPEVSATISALRSAQRTGAGEQLGGQLASLQIAMSKLNDKKMAWVTSGDDFTLDINVQPDPEKGIKPRIVVLGNDDMLKKSYAPALSLFASTCAGLINQKDRVPCAFIIDECPTLFIQNIENLPNTGRSNKIVTCIAMQDFSQLALNYGDKAAKVLRAGFGNVFIGEVSDEDTAKYASNLIGKGIVTRQNVSDNDQSSSISFNEHMDLLIHPHEIMRLNTGEFVGKVTDVPPQTKPAFLQSERDKSKIFAARFEVEKPAAYYRSDSSKEFRYSIPVTPHFASMAGRSDQEVDQVLRDNLARIRKEIRELVEREFWTIKIRKYMMNSPHDYVREEYEALRAEEGFGGFCEPYLEMAADIYNTITSNAIATDKKGANPNNFVFSKIIESIESDLRPEADLVED